MSLDTDIQQGDHAERVLSDTSVYFDMVESAILTAWRKSPVGDEKGQHELRLMLKLLDDVKANMTNAIQSGKLAKIQIEQENMLTKAKNAVRRFS